MGNLRRVGAGALRVAAGAAAITIAKEVMRLGPCETHIASLKEQLADSSFVRNCLWRGETWGVILWGEIQVQWEVGHEEASGA
jgi:hypothetical protein